jgi:hypothetical protein
VVVVGGTVVLGGSVVVGGAVVVVGSMVTRVVCRGRACGADAAATTPAVSAITATAAAVQNHHRPPTRAKVGASLALNLRPS